MFKKHLLILVLIAYVQSTSGFLATLTAINGARVVLLRHKSLTFSTDVDAEDTYFRPRYKKKYIYDIIIDDAYYLSVNGVRMVVDFIQTLPSAVHSVKEVIASFKSDKPTSFGYGAAIQKPVTQEFGMKNLTTKIERYHKVIMQKFQEIDFRMDNLRLFVSDRFTHIEELIQNLPQQIDLMLKRQTIGQFIMSINQKWNRFMRFVESGADRTVYSYEMNNNLRSIEPDLAKFRGSIIPLTELSTTAFGLLTDIAEMQRAKGQSLCNGETSHHSVINIFQIIIQTEIKAFTLQALAFNEAFPENDGWKQMLTQSRIELKQQLDKYINDLRSALAIEKKTYIKACFSTDSKYHAAVFYGIGIQVRDLIPRDCTIVDTVSSCERFIDCKQSFDYTWLLSSMCQRSRSVEPVALKSSLCMCMYYNKFILTTMQSRLGDNNVVVAVRFQKHKDYIYIQVAEGKLEANGYISDYKWVIPTRKSNGDDPFQATLSINEAQIMALGDVDLPPGYILTGIKLSPGSIFGEKGYRIGLYGVKFDYETGKLDLTNDIFVPAPDSSRYQSQYSAISDSRNPTENTVVEFRVNDYNPYNLTTLPPKLNAADVLPNPLSPIGGVGVFYEIAPNNVPCISLRLSTINYMIFMNGIETLDFKTSISIDECNWK